MKKTLIQKAAVLVCVTTSVMLAGCGSSAEDNQKSEKEASVADSIDAYQLQIVLMLRHR